MKNIQITLFLLSLNLFSCNTTAQQVDERTDECNCRLAYNDLIGKLESNYIGLAQ
jgi:hypothetical protein